MTDTQTINYIDINKGFRRVGNFPAFQDEVFKTYKEASEYAQSGKYGGSSYVGQLIRVLPEDATSDPSIYIINNDYRLASTAEHIESNTKLSINFDFDSMSGSEAISLLLPQDFILSNISVHIVEGFKNCDAFSLVLCPYNDTSSSEFLIQSGTPFMYSDPPDNLILTDEDDAEFNFHFTKQLTTKSLLIVFLKRDPDADRCGAGILKIN